MRLDDVVTPALLVDVEVLEDNLQTMAAFFDGRPCGLRPHFKAHKCVEIARRQRDHGTVGVTAQIAYEALVLARAGFGDILVANQTVGPAKVAMLREAASQARVTVAVDSPETIEAVVGTGVDVVVEVDVGLPRCGAPPDRVPDLAALARRRGLGVRGVQGYEGHAVLIEDREKRAAVALASVTQLLDVAAAVDAEVVTAGGTGTYDITGAISGVTEIQAGSYALMDTAYAALGLPFGEALSCLATVISTTTGRSVLDAGLKAVSTDHGPPLLHAGEAGAVAFLSDEHTVVRLAEGERSPRVGDRVRLRPSHVDPTVALYDRLWAVAGDRVIDWWPVWRGWGP